MVSDKTTGTILLLTLSAAFSYYTFWVIIMPFVDDDHVLQTYFPNREIGLAVPLITAWAILMLTMAYIGIVMTQGNKS